MSFSDPSFAEQLRDTLLKSRREMESERSGDEDGEPEPRSLGAAHWLVQPRWVKLYTLCVGLPAWVFLAAEQWFASEHPRLDAIAMGLFGLAALLQIAFVFRAYWRMDI